MEIFFFAKTRHEMQPKHNEISTQNVDQNITVVHVVHHVVRVVH